MSDNSSKEVIESMKEPEDEKHQEECELIKPPGESTDASSDKITDDSTEEEHISGSGDTVPNTDAEEKEKGQMDEEPESNKEDKESWTFVLGHELLKKRVLTDGEGVATRPTNGQIVTIKYSATVHEETTVVDSKESSTFTLGDGDVIMAFDLCVALMEKGEVCEVVTDAKYAYGPNGRKPDIPGNASLHYTIELLDVQPALKPSEMSAADRVEAANSKRERGNQLYSHNDYSSAITSYTKALKILDMTHDKNIKEDSDRKMLSQARVKCYNNLAAAQLKVDAWDAAIRSSNSVLKEEPKNVKALFRKGKCLAGKGDISTAISTLREALKLEPETKIIHQELSRLVAKKKAQEDSEREMYQRMIGVDKNKALEKKGSSRWWLMAGGAAAALVSVGFGVYRHLQL